MTDDLTADDDAPPIGAAYGYVAIPLPKLSMPYRGAILAHFIELAWRKVEIKIPNWRPGIYRMFVFSLLQRVSEYQSAIVVVEEGGSFKMGKLLDPLDD